MTKRWHPHQWHGCNDRKYLGSPPFPPHQITLLPTTLAPLSPPPLPPLGAINYYVFIMKDPSPLATCHKKFSSLLWIDVTIVSEGSVFGECDEGGRAVFIYESIELEVLIRIVVFDFGQNSEWNRLVISMHSKHMPVSSEYVMFSSLLAIQRLPSHHYVVIGI